MEGRKPFHFHGHFVVTVVIFLIYIALSHSKGFCPEEEYYYPGDESCISVVLSTAEWESARTSCQENGGDLVKVPDEAFNDFLLGILQVTEGGSGYAIGLHDQDEDGAFKWLDEVTAPTFTFWHAWSPNISKCVSVHASTHLRWLDGPCTGPDHRYVCQQPSSSFGTLACPDGWHFYGDHGRCFKATDDPRLTWFQGYQSCAREGGKLAAITSSGINDFVINLLSPAESYWIALNDAANEGAFVWLAASVNTTFEFYNGDGIDNQDEKDCVIIESYSNYRWNVDSCSSFHLSICERWAEPLVEACPTGEFYFPVDQTCISLHHDAETWTAARDVCQQDAGGDLVKLTDYAINEFFIGIVQRAGSGDGDYWIGLNDRNVDGHFRWLDEETGAGFASWCHDEPNYGKGNVHCVQGSAARDYRWKVRKCDKPTSFSCQKPSGLSGTLLCPPGGDWHLFASQGRCFKVMDGYMLPWKMARDTCMDEGGDLAAITSYAINDFLTGKLSLEGNYWFGLNDLQTEGQFRWLDATTKTTFTFWNAHEPNNGRGDEDCARIQHGSNFQWNDAHCDTLSWFICERPAEMQI